MYIYKNFISANRIYIRYDFSKHGNAYYYCRGLWSTCEGKTPSTIFSVRNQVNIVKTWLCLALRRIFFHALNTIIHKSMYTAPKRRDIEGHTIKLVKLTSLSSCCLTSKAFNMIPKRMMQPHIPTTYPTCNHI